MTEFNNPYVEKATQEIDAAMFSGDAFVDPRQRVLLRSMMARWERGLLEFDKFDDDENPSCDNCGTRIGRDGCDCPVGVHAI